MEMPGMATFGSVCVEILLERAQAIAHFHECAAGVFRHGTAFEGELFDENVVQLARMATRSPVHPLRVGWPAPDLSPSDAAAYAAWFGVPVEHLPLPTVVFKAEDMQRPFLTANHGMWKFFEPTLRQRLDDLQKHASTVERLRSALLEALPAGEVSMPAVCRKLGVSTRTLQRRLQEEGSSLQQTLDALRNSLAHRYLYSSSLSSTEISFLLGFEDPKSFVRAFQTWTGSTPHAVRLAHSQAGGEASLPA
jgi:AraC-like DNA-binding protein